MEMAAMSDADEKPQARGGDMDAPDRIWAWTELDVDGSMWGTVQKFWISNPDVRTGEETEYVRADLMAELVEALETARDYVDDAAKLGAGDGLVERLNRADEYEPLGHDGWEAAAHIAALTAQNRELALDVLASSGQAQDAYAAQLAAEAERDALRAKVARLEGALRHYRETLCEGFCGEDMWADEGHSHPEIQRDCGGCLAASVLLSAALTDGAADE